MPADLLARVRRDLERHALVRPGERVVVALSGGPDSTALLHLLWRLRADFDLTLIAATLDHGLRDTERDRRWARELCQELGVPLRLGRVPRGALRGRPGGIEAAARRARYAFLKSVAREEGAGRIAVAHTADDQAETVLMRLLRGAGPAGLAGMAPRRPDGVIRPLLSVWRSEVAAYLAAQNLKAVDDPTNADLRLLRNRIRRQVLPFLSRLNPGLPGNLVRLATLLREEEEFLGEAAAQAWERVARPLAVPPPGGRGEGFRISRRGLAGLPTALRRRVTRIACAGLGREGLPFEHAERLIELAVSGRTGARLDLPGRLVAEVDAESLYLYQRPGGRPGAGAEGGVVPEDRGWPLSVPGRTDVPALGITVLVEAAADGEVEAASEGPPPPQPRPPWIGQSLWLNPEVIQGRLRIRLRQPGDRILLRGLQGRKKLSDLFIDEKVPRLLRDHWPILTDAAGVLWVPGLRAGARAVGSAQGQAGEDPSGPEASSGSPPDGGRGGLLKITILAGRGSR